MKRILISMLLGLVLGGMISEISFLFLQETTRAPKDVVLTIPAGTADQVARGEQPPSIPTDMLFVVGDTLVVKNDDVVDHKLGPLWIPAHSSARMPLGQAESVSFDCSFQPAKQLGLDVREALTLSTRIYGILNAGLPMGMLFALYSFVIPSKKKENVAA
jgi:hypothetical protein